MGQARAIGCMAAVWLTLAPAALASTQTAHSGEVAATLTFSGRTSKTAQHLSITRAGRTAYSARVTSKYCGRRCGAFEVGKRQSSVHVLDLEHTGQPDVVLDLFTGGAHCCVVEQIFSFDPATNSYMKTERNFGDPGMRIVDLDHNGRYELLTADDSFAYRFTDYAASGLPIQILTFAQGQFRNVTRSYPKQIAHDAAIWLKAFKSMGRSGYRDSTGVIAAWAADEDLLGHSRLVSRYLNRQAKASHLNSALDPAGSGKKFIARLQKFLRKRGYLH